MKAVTTTCTEPGKRGQDEEEGRESARSCTAPVPRVKRKTTILARLSPGRRRPRSHPGTQPPRSAGGDSLPLTRGRPPQLRLSPPREGGHVFPKARSQEGLVRDHGVTWVCSAGTKPFAQRGWDSGGDSCKSPVLGLQRPVLHPCLAEEPGLLSRRGGGRRGTQPFC